MSRKITMIQAITEALDQKLKQDSDIMLLVGPFGGLFATSIINHPEVAILALHKMEPRVVVRDSQGVIRQMMNISLSLDHRIIDGVTAVKFTNRIKELLENPNLLFLEMR